MSVRDEIESDVVRLHGEGLCRKEIAEELGADAGLVGEICQSLGLIFRDSTDRKNAGARLEQAAEQRARIMKKMNDAAEKMLGLIDQPVIAFNFGGRDNTYNEHELTEPTIADKLKLMQAAKVGVDAGLALAAADAGSARVSINLILATAEKLGLDTSDGE